MTYTLIARHEVTDYDTWKQMFDGSGELHRMAGIIATRVHRDVDNPNMVTVQHQFPDAGTAKAFFSRLDSDEFRNNDGIKKAGVKLETMVGMMMEDVV